MRHTKYYVIIVILAACVCLATAQARMTTVVVGGGQGAAAAVNECDGMIVCQNFEGTISSGWITDNSETWTRTDTTNVFVTDTGPLRGVNSVSANTSYVAVTPTFSATGSVYGHFLFKMASDSSDNRYTVFLYSGATPIIEFNVHTGNTWEIRSGGDSLIGYTSGAMTAGTVYRVWIKYVKGASNAQYGIYFDAAANGTTRPSAAAQKFEVTNGTINSDITSATFGAHTDIGPALYDQILLKTTEFTTVSE